MCKLTITLLLNLFRMIYTHNPAIKYYQVTTEQDTVDNLIEIQHSQALPLVLVVENDSMELRHPEFLSKIFTDKGRIINYTEFGNRKSPSHQFLFCPKENSTEKCLVHKDFRPLEPLQCSEEPKPILEPDNTKKCSFEDIGTVYTLFYEICANQEPYEFETQGNRKLIYEICYDSNKRKILSTTHSILHPKLLSSNELYRERNIQYSTETMDEFILSNQQELEAAIVEESNVPNTESQNKKQKTGKHVYKAQKLVPAEDMAFALWRKPTFLYINTELQHENFIELWNEINHYIRLHIEKLFVNKALTNYIVTSILDLDNTPKNDDQLPNMWVKTIYLTTKDEINATEMLTQATVVLMNNFIKMTAAHDTLFAWNKLFLDYFCDHQDFCAESLKEKFEQVGGAVRCCRLNPDMSQLIGVGVIDSRPEIMLIPGITEISS